MKVSIQFISNSVPVVYENVRNKTASPPQAHDFNRG